MAVGGQVQLLAEQSMPFETTPIFSARSMRRSLAARLRAGRPARAGPGAMLVAPQTTDSGSPEPRLTVVSESLSARG